MVGHYLLTLPVEAEDWALTRRMVPFFGYADGVPLGPCLLQVTHAEYRGTETAWCGSKITDRVFDVGARFDDLCWRFGVSRVNTAIRNRILSNRARRILQNPPISRDTEVMDSVR